jgi:hypothetical protein
MDPTQSPESERLEQRRQLISAFVRRKSESFRCCRDAYRHAAERGDYALACAAIKEAYACIREAQRSIDHRQAALHARCSALTKGGEVARSQPVKDGNVVRLFPPNRAKLCVLAPVHAMPSLDRIAIDGRRLLAQLSTANPAALRMIARNLRELSHHANVWARWTDNGAQDGFPMPDDSQACAEDFTGNDARDDESAPPIALRSV